MLATGITFAVLFGITAIACFGTAGMFTSGSAAGAADMTVLGAIGEFAMSATRATGWCSAAVTAVFGWLTAAGASRMKAAKTLELYADTAEGFDWHKGLSLSMLAELTHKKKAKALRLLRKFIHKGWLSAWVDEKNDKLYLTAEDYRTAQENQPEPEPEKSAGTGRGCPPEPRDDPPLCAGAREGDPLMEDERAVEELQHMQKTTESIGAWLEAHPESLPKARRFAEYYIPTTLKLLHTYNDVQGQQGENAEAIRRDIAGILHTLNQAYDNLYDKLFVGHGAGRFQRDRCAAGDAGQRWSGRGGNAMTYRAWNTKEVDRAALKELTAAIAQQNTEELENQSMDDGPWSEEKYRSVFAAQQKGGRSAGRHPRCPGHHRPRRGADTAGGRGGAERPHAPDRHGQGLRARILRAIDEGETIVVFGDYDVDGVTATALLYQHLKGMGASAKCMLPSREGDGYGLSKNAIQSIYDKGCRLIVTVDNGISAVEEAAFAASLGIDLIITDHHLPHESLPQAVAIIDPRRADDHSPFKGLCGAGVAFKLCAALDGCPPEEMLEYCGDLAAVGTVADVMPLTGENRTIVKAGLRQLQNTDRPGFCALLEEVGLAGRPVTAENVSYAIAPRINAAGRMDSAVTALQLVLCEDEDRAEELAHKLTDINSQRQETEMEIVRAAQELLDAEPERLEDRVILLWGRDWHPGVIGIVASRLVEKTGRPVIVVSVDEHGEGKGSGRSVQGFNLHECIASCADILLRFGGHAMAAGLSVREEDLPTLRQRLNDWAARECPVLHTTAGM